MVARSQSVRNICQIRKEANYSASFCTILSARDSTAGVYIHIIHTSRVPVGGKASVCLICMKYRIIILIIIIKRLGEILLSYIAHTSRTHTPLPLS